MLMTKIDFVTRKIKFIPDIHFQKNIYVELIYFLPILQLSPVQSILTAWL